MSTEVGRADTARADWTERIATRSDQRAASPLSDLPPPTGLTGTPGSGHVTLRWEPVGQAVGYLVHRAPAGSPRAALAPVDHLGGDLLEIPDTSYVDTTGEPGMRYDYALHALPSRRDPAAGDRDRRRGRRSGADVGITSR